MVNVGPCGMFPREQIAPAPLEPHNDRDEAVCQVCHCEEGAARRGNPFFFANILIK